MMAGPVDTGQGAKLSSCLASGNCVGLQFAIWFMLVACAGMALDWELVGKLPGFWATWHPSPSYWLRALGRDMWFTMMSAGFLLFFGAS